MAPAFDEHTLTEDRLTRAAARLEALARQAETLIDAMMHARRELVAAVTAALVPWPWPRPPGDDPTELNRIAAEHAAMWRGRTWRQDAMLAAERCRAEEEDRP